MRNSQQISYVPTACQFPQLIQIGVKLGQKRPIQVVIVVAVVEKLEQQALEFLRTHSMDIPAEEREYSKVRF